MLKFDDHTTVFGSLFKINFNFIFLFFFALQIQHRDELVKPGNPHWRGRLITIDLLMKVAYFVKGNKFLLSKVADLNYLIQGGQLYWAFPFSKRSTIQHDKGLVNPWNPHWKGRLSTIDLLMKVAYFVKK
jgi:hypothetical protein